MRLTDPLPGSGGILRAVADDFHVEESLPYAPSGEGGHVFVRIEKRNLDTLEAARRLVAHLGLIEAGAALPAEVGVAGLKDRRAVARQWISLPWPEGKPVPEPSVLASSEHEHLAILEAIRHRHKLRRGHVSDNRFVITLRRVPLGGTERAQALLERLRTCGVPNTFGPQRFGAEGNNADRARAILHRRAPRPRDKRIFTLLCSALQAEVFNHVLSYRIREGLFARALEGDRMVKHATGGQFVVEAAEEEQPRVDALEISPTGPLPGKRSPEVRGAAAALEMAIQRQLEVDADLARRLGPGGRRPLRIILCGDTRIEPIDPVASADETYRLFVRLPSGVYATSLLDELVKPADGAFRRELMAPGDDP